MDPNFVANGISNYLAIGLLALVFLLIVANCINNPTRFVSARNTFLVTIGLWFVLEACNVPAEIEKYSQEQYDFGVFTVFLSVCGFLAAYTQTRPRFLDRMFWGIVRIDSPSVLSRTLVSGLLIGFLPLIIIAQGDIFLILSDAFIPDKRWSGPFQRGRYGGLRDAFLELQMFLNASVPLATAILLQRRQNPGSKLLSASFLAYMFARAVNSGARSTVATVAFPFMAGCYWKLSAPSKRLAVIVGGPLIIVGGIAYSAAAVAGRNQGGLEWEKVTTVDYIGFEMFRELLFIQSVVPEKAGYQFGYTYYVQAVNPIPRFLWKNKPVGDAGLQLSVLQGSVIDGEAYLTTSPGMIGEMYWNFGIPGVVLLSALIGYISKAWDHARPITTRSMLAFTVYIAGLAILFLSGRSFVMSSLYGVASLLFLLRFFDKRSRMKFPHPPVMQRR